jgi:hypothetical protein
VFDKHIDFDDRTTFASACRGQAKCAEPSISPARSP